MVVFVLIKRDFFVKRVIVGSRNDAKIKAVEKGFKKMFPDESFEIEGVRVDSGVRPQPRSDEETIEGAVNRVVNAKKVKPGADFWIGLEGGIHFTNHGLENFAWIVVEDECEERGKARTATYILPSKMSDLLKQGRTLSEAVESTPRVRNKKQESIIGAFTNELFTRTSYYSNAVILALIRFKNEKVFND